VPATTPQSDHHALAVLCRRVRGFAWGRDLLLDLVGGGRFAEMAMTRDGILLGRPRRSTTFDAFIGEPTTEERRRVARVFAELRASDRRVVLDRLAAQGIEPAAVGIPAGLCPA